MSNLIFLKIGFFVGGEKWTDKTGLVLQESENCSQ
jgi:hypothetical protein